MSIRVLNRGKPIIGTSGGGSSFDTATEWFTGSYSLTIPSDVERINNKVGNILPANIIYFNNTKYIGESCFYGCKTLEEININNVKTISSGCFYNCFNLKDINNSANLISIGSNAFYNCRTGFSLLSLSNLRYIGQNCFGYCTNLEEVNFPNLIYAEFSNFESCIKLSSINMPNLVWHSGGNYLFNKIKNSSCNVELGNLVYCGYLFSICGFSYLNLSNLCYAEGAMFYNCSGLSEYSNIKLLSCGQSNFYGNKNIKSIYLPALSSIPGSFANGCSVLEDVNVFFAISTSNQAFANCPLLSSFSTCTKFLAQQFFVNDSNFESLYMFNVSAPQLYNINAFQNTPLSNSTYLGHFGSIYIPNHPAAMSNYANATNWLNYSSRIVLMDSSYASKYIYGMEFYSDTSLTDTNSLIGRENIEIICTEAFRYCTNLSNVSFSQCKVIGAAAFDGCNLKSVSLPLCEIICNGALYNKQQLTSLYIPNVITIGSNALTSCNKISSFDLPFLRVIGNNAFLYCSMINMSCPNVSFIGTEGIAQCSSLTTVNIENCKVLSERAFNGCKMLSNINAPNLEIIGSSCFQQCSALSVFSNNAKLVNNYAFSGCSNLTDVKLKEAIYLGGGAFSGCSKLTNVEIDKIENINANTFYNCYSLSTILCSKLISIGGNAFANCSSLSNIDLRYVESIYSSAFQNCNNLKSVRMDNLINIEQSVFSGCSRLTSIYILTKFVPYASSNNIINANYNFSIFVRSSLLSAFQNAIVWSNYASKIVGLTDEEIAQLS